RLATTGQRQALAVKELAQHAQVRILEVAQAWPSRRNVVRHEERQHDTVRAARTQRRERRLTCAFAQRLAVKAELVRQVDVQVDDRIARLDVGGGGWAADQGGQQQQWH